MKTKASLSISFLLSTLVTASGTAYAHSSHSEPPRTGAVTTTTVGTQPGEKPNAGPQVSETTAAENRDRVSVDEHPNSNAELIASGALENPIGLVGPDNSRSGTDTANDLSVSKWLEARASKEAAVRERGVRNSATNSVGVVQGGGIGTEGAGWCDNCGCWLRHGCDSNGNCEIGHYDVCNSGNLGCAQFHPNTHCINTG